MSLSTTFLNCLLSGHLKTLHDFLSLDATLSPEIRDDRLTIYYRGGRILSILRDGQEYRTEFDDQYLKGTHLEKLDLLDWQEKAKPPASLNSSLEIGQLLRVFPIQKTVMDLWFSAHRPLERETVQRLIRENNRDLARGTDYFICDFECVQKVESSNKSARFDFVAVHWPSSAASKKNPRNLGLVIGEAKYGGGAINGSAGLDSHLRDLATFVGDKDALDNLKRRMIEVFDQKRQLGLIQNKNSIETFADERPTWLLVIANHDPESTILNDALRQIETHANTFPMAIKIAVSNFMGYGLFDQAIYGLSDFLETFGSNVHHTN